MKIFLLASIGALASATKIPYGPSNCVALDLSSEGTCVIKTNCAGVDVENFEFAFDCTTPKHEVQRHSFGFGGFDAQEDFDTSVKCTICEPPTDTHHALVGTASSSKTSAQSNTQTVLSSSSSRGTGADEDKKKDKKADKKADKKKDKKSQSDKKSTSDSEARVVKYGPNECVSTKRNSAGHCIMETQCGKEDISEYEFGLICVDKTGEPVRHVFGKNSFDPEESFDTLIACDKCLGLDDMADETSLVKQVESLTSEVEDMNKTLSSLRKSVKKLNAEVKPGGKPAPPQGLTKISSSTKEQPVEAAHRKHAKLHLKNSKKHSSHHNRKIQKEEEADADDDQDEDQVQEQDEDEDQEEDDQQDDSEEA